MIVPGTEFNNNFLHHLRDYVINPRFGSGDMRGGGLALVQCSEKADGERGDVRKSGMTRVSIHTGHTVGRPLRRILPLPCSVVSMPLPSSLSSGNVTICSPRTPAHQRWQALPWRDALPHGAVAHLGLQGLQAFPAYGLRHEYRSCFEALPSCGRFVRLVPRLLLPLTCS